MRETQSILGQHFSIAGQLKFTSPRMLMSPFIMSYMVADGVLISRYMGTVALASLNMIFPLAIFLGAVGIMLSAGGGSVVSRRMGAGLFRCRMIAPPAPHGAGGAAFVRSAALFAGRP